jgi:predicted outer membrane repeat protein
VLRLEALEARLTPVTVNSLADMPLPPPPNIITLRSAIDSGVTSIDFAPGLSGDINLNPTLSTLPTLKNGTIINNATGNSIRVKGNWAFQLINTKNGANVEIDNLEMDQGGGVNYGAGIDNAGNLTLKNCYMTLNQANMWGGAIYNGLGDSVTLEDTTLFENTASQYGGAIYSAGGGSVTIGSGSVIESNSATFGGGIYNSAELTISGATVTNNGASKYGGGIYNLDFGTVTMSGASLTNNYSSDLGGGLYSKGTVTLEATDIKYNSAANAGGGFYLASGGSNGPASLTLTYCTLSNNISPVGAGGAWQTGTHYTDNGGNTITNPVVEVP